MCVGVWTDLCGWWMRWRPANRALFTSSPSFCDSLIVSTCVPVREESNMNFSKPHHISILLYILEVYYWSNAIQSFATSIFVRIHVKLRINWYTHVFFHMKCYVSYVCAKDKNNSMYKIILKGMKRYFFKNNFIWRHRKQVYN